MCTPPRTPFERGRHQGGGGADLRVRSAGFGSEENRAAGQPRDLDRKPMCAHQEHHPAKPCPEGTFLDSPGFVRSTTLGCVAIIHFSPERAGLTEAAGMNRGLKSTSIVRVRSPTIGPVPATAA